jgi:hypothetical protein
MLKNGFSSLCGANEAVGLGFPGSKRDNFKPLMLLGSMLKVLLLLLRKKLRDSPRF